LPAREAWERERSTWPNHAASRFVAAGGICWHVQQMGSGPPLLLVHGTGASTHSWRDVMPILARHFSVLAADLPGHGFTNSSSGACASIHGMSECLSALLAELSFKPRYCVGHSAGAVILCRMALDQRIDPRLIIGINGAFMPLGGAAGVLFSPLARVLSKSAFLPRLLSRRAGNPQNVARVLDGTGSRIDAQGLDFYTRLVRNPQHVAGALAMMGGWDLRSFARDLPRLTPPLALVVGGNDRTVPPRQALDVQRLVPHATICSMPGLGHLAHEEQPAAAAKIILELCGAVA
jgi:magnesium chelatase accessory protein